MVYNKNKYLSSLRGCRLLPQLEEDHRVADRTVRVGEVRLVLVGEACSRLLLDEISDQAGIECNV